VYPPTISENLGFSVVSNYRELDRAVPVIAADRVGFGCMSSGDQSP